MEIQNFLLWGQPGSGKTTLANEIAKQVEKIFVIDGDDLREATGNKNYGANGRLVNISNAIMFTKLLNIKGYSAIISLVCPYKQMRDMVRFELPGTKFVYLYYNRMAITRGREQYWPKDFEQEEKNDLEIHTGIQEISSCVNEIKKLYVGQMVADQV